MNFPPPTARQARIIWLAVTGLAVAVLVGLAAALVWGLSRLVDLLSPVLWPLAVAGVIAYLLDPLVDRLEGRGASRVQAIAAVFGAALLVVAVLFGSIVPQLVNETRQFAVGVPAYVERLQNRLEYWATHSHVPAFFEKYLARKPGSNSEVLSEVSTNAATSGAGTNAPASASPAAGGAAPSVGPLDQGTLATATGWLAKAVPAIGKWLFGQVGRVASWLGVLAGVALIPVYAFYFLLEKRGISSHWTNYLPLTDSSFKQELVFVLNSINNYLIAFFRGQVLVAICDGLLYALGFLVIGLPYAALLGAAAIFLTMIPFLGAIITCVTALLIAVVQSGGWRQPLLVLAVFGFVQAMEGLVISPRIMGGRVGLHPVTIIIAVMVGTTVLGGLLGGILAIPLTAALRVVMFRYIWRRPTAS
jgi:predicted PurR-regulated permease PerM